MKATCTRCGSPVTSKRSRNTCSCGGRLDYVPQPTSPYARLAEQLAAQRHYHDAADVASVIAPIAQADR